MKKIMSVFLLVVILMTLSLSVQAAEMGSIQVNIKYNGQNITGGKLIAVRVGYPDWSEGVFKTVTDHETIEDFTKPLAATEIEELYLEQPNLFDSYSVDVKDGIAKFDDLPAGLYLIRQEKPADGYECLGSFLVTIPYNGVYDVTTDSKSELKRDPKPNPLKPPPINPDDKLPQTGQLTWPVPVMTVSGMLFFCLGLALTSGNGKEYL